MILLDHIHTIEPTADPSMKTNLSPFPLRLGFGFQNPTQQHFEEQILILFPVGSKTILWMGFRLQEKRLVFELSKGTHQIQMTGF